METNVNSSSVVYSGKWHEVQCISSKHETKRMSIVIRECCALHTPVTKMKPDSSKHLKSRYSTLNICSSSKKGWELAIWHITSYCCKVSLMECMCVQKSCLNKRNDHIQKAGRCIILPAPFLPRFKSIQSVTYVRL